MKTAYIIFIFTLVFAPLPYGSVDPWALMVMEGTAMLGLVVFLARQGKEGTPLYRVPGIAPYSLLLLYMLLQLVPLPAAVVRFISPATYALYSDTVGIVYPVKWISLSIYRQSTVHEFFRLFSYGCFYVLTVQLLSRKALLKKTVGVVMAVGSFLALAGIIKYAGLYFSHYGFPDLLHLVDSLGLYVCRNHFAGLMEMLFPMALCLFLVTKPVRAYGTFREKIYEFLSQKRTSINALYALAALLMGASVFLSLSRGGIISLCTALLVLAGALTFRQARRGKVGLTIAAFSGVLLFVTWFGWEPIFSRFGELMSTSHEIDPSGRVECWRGAKAVIMDFPVTGTGFGTFVSIYPGYRTENVMMNYAHNDFLEWIMDGGGLAAALAVWFLVSLFYRSFQSVRKRHEPYSIYLYMGCLTGIVSILIHSITDFNLHIGANGLYFSFLCGLMVSAANTRLREGLKSTNMEELTALSRFRPVAAGGAGLILILCLLFHGGGLRANRLLLQSAGEASDASDTGQFTISDMEPLRDAATTAVRLDPLDASCRLLAADSAYFLSDYDTASGLYQQALQLAPTDAACLLKFGQFMNEYHRPDLAEKLLAAGVRRDPKNPVMHRMYAALLIEAGKKDEAIESLRSAMDLNPDETKACIMLGQAHGFTDEEIESAIPAKAGAVLFFADYLLKNGRTKNGEAAYLKALEHATREPDAGPESFVKICDYFQSLGRDEEALNIMLQAVTTLPYDAAVRVKTALLYEKLGIKYRAIEEYRKALVLHPGNPVAMKRLEGLVD